MQQRYEIRGNFRMISTAQFNRNLIFIAIFSAVAFLLHFIWEYFQCIPFFIHGELPPTMWSMLLATLGDVTLTWFAFFIVVFIARDFSWWAKKWSWRVKLILMGLAVIFSAGIEVMALKSGRWFYTDFNPVIFGTISVIPILQLLLLFPITFYISKKIFINLENRNKFKWEKN